MSASTRSSAAMPAEPYTSKKADCGLNAATWSPSASTSVRAHVSAPAASALSPQAFSRDGCGSIPTHSGPRAVTTSRSRRQ